MIKAEELRIGNYVTRKNFVTRDTELVQWNIERFALVCDKISSIEEFSPILLNEKWLLKFGFSKNVKYEYYTLFLSEDNSLSAQRIDYWPNDELSVAELCYAGVCFKRVKLKHVHQLQNLYFAITGEELTIKPE
jgi:hypothetical protein